MFLNPDVLPEKPYKKEYMDGYKMRAFMLARYGIMIHSMESRGYHVQKKGEEMFGG